MKRRDDVCAACGERRLRELTGSYCARALLCSSCGHIFVPDLPDPNELESVYEVYGYDGSTAEGPEFLRGILDETVASFRQFRLTGRLLDVGFGGGGFLRSARKAGWDTWGIERSRAAVERARAEGFGTILEGDFVTSPLEEGSFDVIVMSEILEHLTEPSSFLRRAARLLRPGGLLYATTPHGRGVSGRALGASWSVLRPPEHLQLFSVLSLRRMLEESGFAHPTVYTQSVLPHELVAMVRKKVARKSASSTAGTTNATEPGIDRVGRSYRLNAALVGSPIGRGAKRCLNLAIRASGVGDSLRVRAVR